MKDSYAVLGLIAVAIVPLLLNSVLCYHQRNKPSAVIETDQPIPWPLPNAPDDSKALQGYFDSLLICGNTVDGKLVGMPCKRAGGE